MEESYLYKEETYKIIGACLEVHSTLGNGFLEAVYEKSLEKELELRSIPFKRNVRFKVLYNYIDLDKVYVADFVCYDKIILELKAVSYIHSDHYRQLLNYLRVTGMKLGLLINFGQSSLKVKRIINTHERL
ncbi:MAG: GxxExxY protein [Bacteroidota bacterium]|nr:GxxExxY protein [Bacteroidota bacterium]